jgi:hypothetical protein
MSIDRLKPISGPSNRALLDAAVAGRSLFGYVLVRRDARVIAVTDARLDDWRDLMAQLDEEPISPGQLRAIEDDLP